MQRLCLLSLLSVAVLLAAFRAAAQEDTPGALRGLLAGNAAAQTQGTLDSTVAVRRGAIQQAVLTRGSVQSLRESRIICPVPGRSTIGMVIAEGQQVSEGDLLCELENTELLDAQRQAEVQLAKATADLRETEQQLQTQDKSSRNATAATARKRELLELQLAAWTEGEYPLRVAELEGAVRLSQVELDLIKTQLKSDAGLSDLEKMRLRVDLTRAEVKYDIARRQLTFLTKYEHQQRLAELKGAIAELDQQDQAQANAAKQQLHAELQSRELVLKTAEDRLERTRAAIKACRITAPHDGVVVYTSTGRRTTAATLKEGQVIRERQALMTVHDISRLVVRLELSEQDASAVRTDQSVALLIDAFPGRKFAGTVQKISEGSARTARGPQLIAEISIDDPSGSARLRPGMTAEAAIAARTSADALLVPVDAVRSRANAYYVLVRNNQATMERTVTLGINDGSFVEVTSGLKEDERVVVPQRNRRGR